jgi:AraC-like DNA-binding protein
MNIDVLLLCSSSCRQIALVELAGIVNVSHFHFARLFKRSTGITEISCVEQCRISCAQSLILETAISLSEIALVTGFADQSHFTRRVHRHVGRTPAAFAWQHGPSVRRQEIYFWTMTVLAVRVDRTPRSVSFDPPQKSTRPSRTLIGAMALM